MRKVTVLALCLLGGFASIGLGAGAQMGGAPDTASIGKPMEPAKALDAMLSEYEHESMGVLKAMPADKYSFEPSTATYSAEQGAKFDGVRTFAQEATHVAQANYFFYSAVGGMKPDVDVKAIGSMTGKEEIVAAMQAAFDFAHKAVATITAANAFTTIKGADGFNTRASLAAFGVAHGYDHYGQMVEYLRGNGVVPPGSKERGC